MEIKTFKIISNKKVANNTYYLELEGKFSSIVKGGQFIEISIPNFFLRRPFAICDVKEKSFTILYKNVGKGTQALSKIQEGYIEGFGPLGNYYQIDKNKDIILVSGGIGLASLFYVAKLLKKENINFKMILGFNSEEDFPLKEELDLLDIKYELALFNKKETPIDYLNKIDTTNSLIYACGPISLLKQIDEKYNGFISLEARMGCGYGVCNGCVIKSKKDSKTLRICKNGPIFKTNEVEF